MRSNAEFNLPTVEKAVMGMLSIENVSATRNVSCHELDLLQLAYFVVLQARQVGFRRALYQAFVEGFRGRIGRTDSAQGQQRGFENVSQLIQSLPTELYVTEDCLSRLSVQELRVRSDPCCDM